jgi:OmpA-OmpF porin, OOP family
MLIALPKRLLPQPQPLRQRQPLRQLLLLQQNLLSQLLVPMWRKHQKLRKYLSIDDAIAKMKKIDVTAIIATGHTDSRGTDAYNQRLSERRATTVKEYMVSKGVPAAKITTQGKGETQPVATNKTDEGRAKNRRVDIEFTGISQ